MDSPAADITHLTSRILTPTSPTAQVAALKKYFAPDASLSHPLCYIPSAPHSRERIIRAAMFLRVMSPHCGAKIRRQAWNDAKGKMTLEMELEPSVRVINLVQGLLQDVTRTLGLRLFADPTPIPVHVFLNLRREGPLRVVGAGPWVVEKAEVVVMPIDVLRSLHLLWLGRAIYFVLYLVLVLIVVVFGQILRLWPHPEFSIFREVATLLGEGYEVTNQVADTVLLPPVAGAFDVAKRTLSFGVGTLDNGIKQIQSATEDRLEAAELGWRFLVWRIMRKLMGM